TVRRAWSAVVKVGESSLPLKKDDGYALDWPISLNMPAPNSKALDPKSIGAEKVLVICSGAGAFSARRFSWLISVFIPLPAILMQTRSHRQRLTGNSLLTTWTPPGPVP